MGMMILSRLQSRHLSSFINKGEGPLSDAGVEPRDLGI
jgi:hypothetical protein